MFAMKSIHNLWGHSERLDDATIPQRVDFDCKLNFDSRPEF